jgi:hypothetical protein
MWPAKQFFTELSLLSIAVHTACLTPSLLLPSAGGVIYLIIVTTTKPSQNCNLFP